jgi:hypothetical protein
MMIENSSKRFRLRGLSLLLFMVMVALLLLLPDIASAVVKPFQNSADVTLSERYSSRNYGTSSLCTVAGSKNSGRELSTLLSWYIGSIPSGREITKATIHLQITNPSKDTFYVYALNKPWREYEATWVLATKKTRWSKEGASGLSDRQSSYVGRLLAKKTGTARIALDPDLVQEWVKRPTKNYGVIIANSKSTDDLGFYCYETTRTTYRPKLEVVYR